MTTTHWEAKLKGYFSDGFAGPFPLLSQRECKALIEEYQTDACFGKLLAKVEMQMTPEQARSMNAIRINRHEDIESLRRLVMHPEIVGGAEHLLGKGIRLWRSAVFARTNKPGTGATWHRDSFARAVINGNPRSHLGVQIALTDTDRDNTIWILRGSQNLSDRQLLEKYGLAYVEGSRQTDTGQALFYEAEIGKKGTPSLKRWLVKRRRQADLAKVKMQAGEYILINPDVMHCSGSGKHFDPSQPLRWAITMRIAAAHQKVELVNYTDGNTRPRTLLALG